jgi:hypothetical protein
MNIFFNQTEFQRQQKKIFITQNLMNIWNSLIEASIYHLRYSVIIVILMSIIDKSWPIKAIVPIEQMILSRNTCSRTLCFKIKMLRNKFRKLHNSNKQRISWYSTTFNFVILYCFLWWRNLSFFNQYIANFSFWNFDTNKDWTEFLLF